MTSIEQLTAAIIKTFHWWNYLYWLYILCYWSYMFPTMLKNHKEYKQLLKDIDQIGKNDNL